jgi:transcriptional regulator GlxA family with amidase domain
VERRRVVGVVFPGFQVLDATGPLEVFSVASRLLTGDRDPRRPSAARALRAGDHFSDAYRVELVSSRGGLVSSSSGISVDTGAAAGVRGPIDTLVVAGGLGVGEAVADRDLITWIGRTARRARRVTSVCTGAFLLAEAGLLDGARVTTHWASCTALGRAYPTVDVDPDPIFVRLGKLATSAGVTSGMDLALALVEEDHGCDVALEAARWLVVFLKRPGGQSQFSGHLRNQLAARPALADLQGWLADHLAEDLTVAALARRAGMHPRTFSRVFRAEVGTTPASYVEGLRLESARHLLEGSERSMRDVARVSGFGTTETMYRAFQRAMRVTPGEYRRRFAPAATA